MKKLLVTIAIITLFSCEEQEFKSNQLFCVSGVRSGEVDRELIGCGTQDQYYNFAFYRVDYTDYKLVPVSACDECN